MHVAPKAARRGREGEVENERKSCSGMGDERGLSPEHSRTSGRVKASKTSKKKGSAANEKKKGGRGRATFKSSKSLFRKIRWGRGKKSPKKISQERRKRTSGKKKPAIRKAPLEKGEGPEKQGARSSEDRRVR